MRKVDENWNGWTRVVVEEEDDEVEVVPVLVVEDERERRDDMVESEERQTATGFGQVVWAPRAHSTLDTAVSPM